MRMNKKKEVVPKLRFPEFVNEDEWKNKRIEQLLTIGNGCDYKHLSKGDIPVYGSGGYMCSVDHFLYDGDSVCIGRKGTIDKPIFLRGKFWTVDTLFYTHSYKNCIPKFIYYIFQRINWLKYNEAGGVPSLSKTTINKINIYIPEIPEQQKIADCLSYIDELIDAESRKLKALEKYKKGLMQKLFPAEGKTLPEWRFPEFRGKSEWRIKPLGKICTNYDSRRIPITEKDRVKGEIPYIGASGVIDYINDFIFDEDLLCVSEDGANLVARTYPIAFSISGKTWVNNHAHVLKFSHNYTQNIVESYLNMINLQDFLTGMAQPKLNRAKLDIIPIPLPEEEEQQKIADCLSEIDTMIKEQSNKVEQLKAHKNGLMQGMFPSLEEADV